MTGPTTTGFGSTRSERKLIMMVVGALAECIVARAVAEHVASWPDGSPRPGIHRARDVVCDLSQASSSGTISEAGRWNCDLRCGDGVVEVKTRAAHALDKCLQEGHILLDSIDMAVKRNQPALYVIVPCLVEKLRLFATPWRHILAVGHDPIRDPEAVAMAGKAGPDAVLSDHAAVGRFIAAHDAALREAFRVPRGKTLFRHVLDAAVWIPAHVAVAGLHVVRLPPEKGQSEDSLDRWKVAWCPNRDLRSASIDEAIVRCADTGYRNNPEAAWKSAIIAGIERHRHGQQSRHERIHPSVHDRLLSLVGPAPVVTGDGRSGTVATMGSDPLRTASRRTR